MDIIFSLTTCLLKALSCSLDRGAEQIIFVLDKMSHKVSISVLLPLTFLLTGSCGARHSYMGRLPQFRSDKSRSDKSPGNSIVPPEAEHIGAPNPPLGTV